MKRTLAVPLTIFLSLAAHAQAASLTYANSTQLLLTSPSTTLTITTGSVADALTVSATSVAVGLSSSTGGTFILTSASYDLTVAKSSNGGTASISCSSGVATIAISQATGQATYTITPTASQCTSPSNGGGGPVGVASKYGLPYTPGGGIISSTTGGSFSAATPSSSSLLAELNALKAELAALLAQAGQTQTASSIGPFARNLSFGMTGQDVKDLQNFLITQASGPAAAKLKAHGTTKTFGMLSFSALKEFQKKAGIVPASGYFGPITRAYVNAAEK